MARPRYRHDIFISHASEDKDAVARPLATEFRSRGLNVWFDEFSLRVGDSLTASIDRGLAGSRFGLVVVSPRFIAKRWTKRELQGLVARQMNNGERVILPVWHEVTHAEVLAFSPPLSELIAATTSSGLAAVADQIMASMPPRRGRARPSPTGIAVHGTTTVTPPPLPLITSQQLEIVSASQVLLETILSEGERAVELAKGHLGIALSPTPLLIKVTWTEKMRIARTLVHARALSVRGRMPGEQRLAGGIRFERTENTQFALDYLNAR